MIFYIAVDETYGRKVLCGTQADAKAINKNFEQIDLPTDKAGLQNLYQEALDRIHELEQGQPIPNPVIVADEAPDSPAVDPEPIEEDNKSEDVPFYERPFDPAVLYNQVSKLGEEPAKNFDRLTSTFIGDIKPGFNRGLNLLNVYACSEYAMDRVFLAGRIRR